MAKDSIPAKSNSKVPKSVVTIDVEKLNVSPEIKKIINNAQAEVIALNKKIRSKAMKYYRIKNKIKNHANLIRHLNRNKYIKEEIVDDLIVSCDT